MVLNTAAGWTAHPRVGFLKGDESTLVAGALSGEFFETLPAAAGLASEALLHIRAALDSAIYQLAWRETGARPTGTAFPLCKDRKYWAGRVKKDLKGLSAKHIAAVEAVQPFQGVSWTKQLSDLSNRDKHDHTLEIVPVYSCKVDVTKRAVDPNDPNLIQCGISSSTLSFVFLPADREIDMNHLSIATDELIGIMAGVVSFLNPLLVAEGVSPLSLRRPDGSPALLDPV